MWVFLNDAFFSIVDEKAKAGKRKNGKPCDSDVLVVRARRDREIERVFGQHMRLAKRKLVVSESDKTDYRYRARIPRSVVKDVMASEVDRVVYGNFKGSVDDDTLYAAYSSVWHVMYRLQRQPAKASPTLQLFKEAI